jgi:transcriptional regulator NrdR family protein
VRSMWCASCRGTYLGVRRLLPELVVVDDSRHRRMRFDPDKLKESFAEPLRKVPGAGFRDPSSGERINPDMALLATDYLQNFVVEELAGTAAQPNGEVTTDQIAATVLRGLHRMQPIAFLRSAVHHRLMPRAAMNAEIDRMAEAAQRLVNRAHEHSTNSQFTWPEVREPPAPITCTRCGATRVARRSRASVTHDLEQQPASCSSCGQRFTFEWGSHAPLLVISSDDRSLFDVRRFRAGIRSAVRKLPGTAAIWSDERLVVSAAHSAAASAIPYIQAPTVEHPIPLIRSGDLWLAAAAALKGIHPLAFVRYAMHSGAVDDLDWDLPDVRRDFESIESTVKDVARRYFGQPRFLDGD